MKKITIFVLCVFAACAPLNKTTKTVSNVVMGPESMQALPAFPDDVPTGMINGRKIENVMIDIVKPQGVDYGNEDNPLTGMKEKFFELFTGMGYSVYITNGTFANESEKMFEVLASDTAVKTKIDKTGTVPDAILRIDWREDRAHNPFSRVGSLVIPGRAELQVRACFWGPDGKLVWKNDTVVPIKRSSFVTGGSVSNQFRQPARRAGSDAAKIIFENVRGFLIFSNG